MAYRDNSEIITIIRNWETMEYRLVKCAVHLINRFHSKNYSINGALIVQETCEGSEVQDNWQGEYIQVHVEVGFGDPKKPNYGYFVEFPIRYLCECNVALKSDIRITPIDPTPWDKLRGVLKPEVPKK